MSPVKFLAQNTGEGPEPKRMDLAGMLPSFFPELPTALVMIEDYLPVAQLQLSGAGKVLLPRRRKLPTLRPGPQRIGQHTGGTELRHPHLAHRLAVPQNVKECVKYQARVGAAAAPGMKRQKARDLFPPRVTQRFQVSGHRKIGYVNSCDGATSFDRRCELVRERDPRGVYTAAEAKTAGRTREPTREHAGTVTALMRLEETMVKLGVARTKVQDEKMRRRRDIDVDAY